jgi:MFS-type transporter involved in bile tolerance (Atg22 family)
MVLGAIQSLSLFNLFKVTKHRGSTQLILVLLLTEKIAIVVGTLFFGFVVEITDSMRNSFFFYTAIFFLLAYIVLVYEET